MRFPFDLAALLALCFGLCTGSAFAHLVEPPEPGDPSATEVQVQTPCEQGFAGDYPCKNTDLVSFVPLAEFGQRRANDIWGWTDPETGVEYALLGLDNGTAFFDLSDPSKPVFIGQLSGFSRRSTWRDIKVDGHYAFVVSEARGHGLQVFDLNKLPAVENPPVIFGFDARYRGISTSHNVVINEETDYAYAVGTRSCGRGMHFVDISDPLNPRFAGCFKEDGYTHDAQCVLYRGPDVDHWGREICFNSNIDTITIVDVTDKAAPVIVSKTPYQGARYVHQGWLTPNQAYFLVNDEFDEKLDDVPTTTYVLDVSDLDHPFLAGLHEHDSEAIDHNLYVRGNHVFEANYRAGIRILRLGDLSQGELGEVAFFDTIPWDDAPDFSGTWSVYPYFESGLIVASDMFQGLFVLRPNLDAIPDCADGVDNDGDGLRDHPEDPTCVSALDTSEALRLDVAIDLLSRWRSHRINLADTRSLRVAVRGSETVDVREIDRTKLRFGPNRASPEPRAWPRFFARRYASRPAVPPGHIRDYDRDGFADLLLRFRLEEAGLDLGEGEVCLAGEISGDAFDACDLVEVVDEQCAPDSGFTRHHWSSPWRLQDQCLGQQPDPIDRGWSWRRLALVRWLAIRSPRTDFVRLHHFSPRSRTPH